MSRYLKVQPFGEFTRFSGSVFAVHGTVFPLYRKRPQVPYGVQCAYDLFEINFSVTGKLPSPYPSSLYAVCLCIGLG